MARTIEIRLHGRGGQGGVTCAKILAAAYASQGWSVQSFGDYAGERSGAPVRAYTRVSDERISNRNKVYRPNHLVVLDPTLLGEQTLAGFSAAGTLLLNTPEPLEAFDDRLDGFRLAVVDATSIARRHRIGTRSVVIVNTTIAGAFARVHGIPLDVLEGVYQALGFASNFAAAREAHDAVLAREPRSSGEAAPALRPAPFPVEPLADHTVGPAPRLATGAWSTQRPHYVESLAPCSAWCPAGNDVVGFIQALGREGATAAGAVLEVSTPLAGVCGRVCPAPCMEACNRTEYDGAVDIRGLERWVADRVGGAAPAVPVVEEPLRVAIVGGGPAGLSAGYTVAALGHRATIFERDSALGGILRSGIPEYRLPREVVDREIEAILRLGVDARCDYTICGDRLAELRANFDAVILATGLQRLRGLEVDGADLPGVEQGLHFLRRVNFGSGAALAGSVVVLGGGNTAVDCARCAVRVGADRVTVAYRRTRDEMPAIREEVEQAEQEGVELLLQLQPVALRGNGRVQRVELAEVVMGEPDETGRRRPVPTRRRRELACDFVLLALGQSADGSMLPPGWELREGRVFEHGAPLRVFVAGDFATGEGTVTHAIGSGRRAAGLALRELGAKVDVFERQDRARSVPLTDIRVDHFLPCEPAMRNTLAPAVRRQSFDEVSRGLADCLEAHRCFSCGHCTHCDTCLVYCPEGIVYRHGPDYAVDYTYCKGCGICVHECPRGGMEMRAP